MKRLLFVISFAALLGSLCDASVRTWTAVNGKKVEAIFVSAVEGVVTLRLKSGKIFKVSQDKLSMQDNQFIEELYREEVVGSGIKKTKKSVIPVDEERKELVLLNPFHDSVKKITEEEHRQALSKVNARIKKKGLSAEDVEILKDELEYIKELFSTTGIPAHRWEKWNQWERAVCLADLYLGVEHNLGPKSEVLTAYLPKTKPLIDIWLQNLERNGFTDGGLFTNAQIDRFHKIVGAEDVNERIKRAWKYVNSAADYEGFLCYSGWGGEDFKKILERVDSVFSNPNSGVAQKNKALLKMSDWDGYFLASTDQLFEAFIPKAYQNIKAYKASQNRKKEQALESIESLE